MSESYRESKTETVTISSGGQNSEALSLDMMAWGCYQIPSTFTGTEVTVQFSINGTNFTNVPTEGSESNPATVTANGTYDLPVKTFTAPYCRLVSGSSEGADRTITVHLRS